MCNIPLLGASVGLGALGKIIGGDEAVNAANRDAAARNAVLAGTLAKEKGYAGDNAAVLDSNIANYAPGSQDAQLADAQAKRTATSTGNMTMSDPNAVPVPSDAPPAVASDLAKRMLAVHDAAVERAGLKAKVGGYGDTWLTNNLNTNAADRDIGVTNNYAEGQKAILPALQDAAAASVYKPPSIWSTLLGGAAGIGAGAAGSGTTPKIDISGLWNPIKGVAG